MSINKYIKEKENIDITYQMFKDKNNINIKEELASNNKIKQNIFKSKPFKLSIALTILLLVLTLTVIGVSNTNKYKHYKLYEKGEDLDEIMENYTISGGLYEPNIEHPLLESLGGRLIKNKECVFLEIEDVEDEYYICGYVSNDVKEKIYKAYHSDISKHINTIFFYDSVFHAYIWASKKGKPSLMGDEDWKDIYFEKYAYPITWYILKKDEDVYKEKDNQFLLGVFELKSVKITGAISNKSISLPLYLENYNFINDDLDPLEYDDKREPGHPSQTFLKCDRINDDKNIIYFDHHGWSHWINKSKKGFLVEGDFKYEQSFSNIEIIDGEQYINVGEKTGVYIFDETYTFQDYIDCYYQKMTQMHHHDNCKYNEISLNEIYGNADLKNMYEYNIKEVKGEKNYLFKINDFINFIKDNRHFDMNEYYPLDILN